MKNRWLMPVLALSAFVFYGSISSAAEEPSLPKPELTLPAQARYELDLVLDQIRSKLRRGKRTEKDLTPELLALDTLIAHYSGTDAETAAEFLLTKAVLYAQVLRKTDAAAALLMQVKQDYPRTIAAAKVSELLAKMGR